MIHTGYLEEKSGKLARAVARLVAVEHLAHRQHPNSYVRDDLAEIDDMARVLRLEVAKLNRDLDGTPDRVVIVEVTS